MQLTEVKDRKTMREFLDTARVLYRDDPAWVCPMDDDIRKIFDPSENAYFKEGEAVRWVLKNEGRLIGRIAAFYHRKKSLRYNQPTGGIGFFECINDREAAFMLFDTSRQWLETHGMEAMDGPVNFGENTNFWGLLVEGFTQPAYGMNYNHPYYQELFESCGFNPYFTQETKHLDLTVPFPERFWKIAEWTMKRPGYSFRHFTYREAEEFARDLKEIHDQAWVYHENFTPLDLDLIMKELRAARPVLIEDFIWFAYHEEKPIAMLVMLPDANQILKHFNGRLDLWNKIRFLYYKWNKTMTRTRITILGVVPKYQGQGIESALFWHLRVPVLKKRPYINEIEISWVGDYNPKMQAVLEAVGAHPGKKHITYRKLFREAQPEQYSSTIPVDTRFRESGDGSGEDLVESE